MECQYVIENNGKETKQPQKHDLLIRSKLNSIDKMISKALIDCVISHKGFTLVVNEKSNYVTMNNGIRTKVLKTTTKKLKSQT